MTGLSGFNGRVAIVTGAGRGLGRSHALALAERGAKVVVNDFGPADPGRGSNAAESVAEEIRALGGEALADGSSVTDYPAVQAMTTMAMKAWGRIDILVNNAGLLRDRTFAKMPLEDFREVMEVHLMGSVHCTKAVWDIMRAQNYGRVVMTTSSSGLFGNFGQSNYGAAKMALVGLMQTLALEGAKHDIRVNCLAPTAATRMTADLMPPEMLELLKPEAVSAGLLRLAAEDAPTRVILNAGAGAFATTHLVLTDATFIGSGADAAEQVATRWDEITHRDAAVTPENGSVQGARETNKALSALQGAVVRRPAF